MPVPKKILLVDDSPTVLLMERLLLQDGPYELLSATSGREAVETALSVRPELILMDVVMPGMDGFEVCRRLRAEEATRTTPIILVTTRGGSENVERGYESGCSDYVTKPFDGNELRAKIESFLGH
ncbi:response regulator [Hyalangium versicolor]|uniref:response regulator n=1 Tax=Hyalangium versicolor TaxID=2861190 RepID=UPI001CCDA3C4|nr:response regulator [Hyalangium versicolor]